MFENLKGRLQSVQGNLSASFRGLSSSEVSDGNRGNLNSDKLNLSAGTEVLERYQEAWAELHSQGEENAKKAVVVDEIIGKLHKRLQIQWRTMNQGSAVLTKLPEVIYEVDSLTARLDGLGELFATVENSLIHLENLIETRKLQNRQLDHRFQLALYKEKKLSQLENTRVTLAREHAEKVALHEARQQRVLKERHEAFEQQFKQDLSLYKEEHQVPKLEIRGGEKNDTKLEEVVLENEDVTALNEFLHESTPEKQTEDAEKTEIHSE